MATAPDPPEASSSSSSQRREVPEGDRSISNAASMTALVEVNGRTVLLTGDADAPSLAAALRRLCAERGVRTIGVDVFVVPHNGSIRNLDDEVLRFVDVDTFAICTNGERFGHPDAETIELIARTHPRARLAFNYRVPTTERWASPDEQARLGITALYPPVEGGTIELRLD